jgi:hypothetical protein
MNKRGADITTVMIFLVVGLVVGVLLIWGFATNWAVFSSLFSSGENVNVISTQCQTSCVSSDTYGFCTMSRTLKAAGLPGGKKEVISNCNDFSKNSAYAIYNIAKCPSISCP